MTPFGVWCHNAKSALETADMEGTHSTAALFLEFICELNIVVVQESAALRARPCRQPLLHGSPRVSEPGI